MTPFRTATLAAMTLAMLACTKRTPEPTPSTPASDPTALQEQVKAKAAEETATTVHGVRRLVHPDVPVYLDGKQLGVLRYGELPSTMTAMAIKPEGDDRFYRLYDYLKAVGVPMDTLKAVHFAGKDARIMSLEGNEVRSRKDSVYFDFAMKTSGLPREDWDFTGLKRTTWVDYIVAVYAFAKRDVPKLHPEHFCYWDEKASACSDSAPYAEGDVAKGTRVYVDGKMVGFVKRRRVDEAGAAVKATDGSDAFSLQAVVKTMGVDLTTAASFELLSGDEVVGRGTKDELVSPKGEIRFTLPKHAHGKILARIPDALQAKETSPSSKEITVTAIEIYRNSPVSKRTVSPVEDVFDVTQVSPEQLQAAIGTGSGRNNDL